MNVLFITCYQQPFECHFSSVFNDGYWNYFLSLVIELIVFIRQRWLSCFEFYFSVMFHYNKVTVDNYESLFYNVALKNLKIIRIIYLLILLIFLYFCKCWSNIWFPSITSSIIFFISLPNLFQIICYYSFYKYQSNVMRI